MPVQVASAPSFKGPYDYVEAMTNQLQKEKHSVFLIELLWE